MRRFGLALPAFFILFSCFLLSGNRLYLRIVSSIFQGTQVTLIKTIRPLAEGLMGDAKVFSRASSIFLPHRAVEDDPFC